MPRAFILRWAFHIAFCGVYGDEDDTQKWRWRLISHERMIHT